MAYDECPFLGGENHKSKRMKWLTFPAGFSKG
jgi:hypothetical protein